MPYSGSPATGWPMASRWARIWWVRPVSSRTRSSVVAGSASSSAKCVTAPRGWSVSVLTRVRWRRSRPRGASIVPVRAGGRPSTSARYSRTSARRASASRSARWVASSRATTSSPEVSLSRRCTIPARPASPPAARPASAWLSVPSRCPRGGVHDEAGRLVDDEQVLVLVGDGEGERRRHRRGRRRGVLLVVLHDHALARGQPVALGHGRAVDRHPAVVDEARRARPRSQRRGQEGVEPRAGVVRSRAELHRRAPGRPAAAARRA